MFAVDTNILVYAHNVRSPLNEKAKSFLERAVSAASYNAKEVVGIPLQACAEFINVCTRKTLEKPLTMQEAIQALRRYTDFLETAVIHPKATQLQTFLSLLETTTSRKKVFDVMLAATLKDNHIEGIYTVNVDDFKGFDFLKVVNPLA